MNENNPQIENGHLDIANELVEQFAKHNIPGTEMRIVWAVLRKTWCWKNGDRKKDFDWISISQFENLTGMKRANVHRHLKSLLSKRIILVIQKDNGKLYYGFNKLYKDWLLSKRITVKSVIQKDTQLLSKRINTKDTLTKDREREALKKELEVSRELLNILRTKYEGNIDMEVEKFLNYWNELNPKGTKRKYQMQPTFEINRRIATWLSSKFSSTVRIDDDLIKRDALIMTPAALIKKYGSDRIKNLT